MDRPVDDCWRKPLCARRPENSRPRCCGGLGLDGSSRAGPAFGFWAFWRPTNARGPAQPGSGHGDFRHIWNLCYLLCYLPRQEIDVSPRLEVQQADLGACVFQFFLATSSELIWLADAGKARLAQPDEAKASQHTKCAFGFLASLTNWLPRYALKARFLKANL